MTLAGSLIFIPPAQQNLTDSVDSSAQAIAARIRGLLAVGERETLEMWANRLGVSGAALGLTIDARAPSPTIEVLAAVAAYHGIDPVWLLSGDYNAASHRATFEHDGPVPRDAAAKILTRLLGTLPSPSEAPPPNVSLPIGLNDFVEKPTGGDSTLG